MTQENKDRLLRLLQQHKALGISDQIDFDKFYLYSIITHSTAIEGSTVTEVEAQLLFDEGITSSKRTMLEQQMNLDLKVAYDYGREWIRRHDPITVDWLVLLASKVMARTGCEYHALGGDFSATKGELRKLNVTAGMGGRSYMSYQEVPARLAAFCEELNKRRKAIDSADVAAVYDLSFWAHFELVAIHPWADGNGRTCRLLMNLLQWEFDVLPTKVLKEDKAEYIQALIDTRESEDLNIFLDCMVRLHCQHLQHDIEQFIRSTSEEMTEQREPLSLLEWPSRDGIRRRQGGQKTIEVDRKGGQKTRDAILDVINRNAKVTSTQMAATLGINRSAVSKHLKKLQADGIIRRVGPDKGGHWEVIKEE
ncbi:MAG: Fic family protein [Prevotella sp.]|nr:Fic family protein [Prevotella sp.]